MSKERDELRHLRWIRYAVGGLVMLVLASSFLMTTSRIDNEAKKTALAAAARTMQEQLNQYHSHWLLNEFPEQVEILGNKVYFDSKGWIIPLTNDTYDCNLLLQVAYPENRVFGEPLQLIYRNVDASEQTCVYGLDKLDTYIEIKRSIGYSVSAKKLT